MTQPLADEFPLDSEQPVKIVWLEANITDKVTGFTFTYKPDPRINGIHPDVTIPRYANTQGTFCKHFVKLTVRQ